MSAAELQTQSTIVFKTDEEVLSYSLNEFKKEQGIFLQEVVDVDGGFAFGKRHCFDHHAAMTRWLWHMPGNRKYVAVAVSSIEQVLTYRGKTFVKAFENIVDKPEMVLFDSFSKLPKMKISDSALRESVSEIIRQLKGA